MKAKFSVKAIEVEVGKLRLHSSVNREVRPARVRKLERTMDLDALGRFAIWRDGRNFYVIDGQHRKLALEALGLADWRVRCDVYEDMTFPEACEQFLKLNDGLTVRPFDKFDKGVKAGRAECVETKVIVEDVGFRVADQSHDGVLSCVAAAMATWRLDEGEALRRALVWSSEAWGFTAVATEGVVVQGLGLVAHAYPNGELDDAALIKKLAKHPGGAAAIIGLARSQAKVKGGTIPRNFGRIVTDIYNKGRRSGALSPL